MAAARAVVRRAVADAAAADAAVMPGTISKFILLSVRHFNSSLALPKIIGSPPLSLTIFL
jgi:hypothetical protein